MPTGHDDSNTAGDHHLVANQVAQTTATPYESLLRRREGENVGLMDATAAAATDGGWQPGPVFVERVKRAYRMALQSYRGRAVPRWFSFGPNARGIHLALLADDGRAAALLADPGKSYIFYGMDNLFHDMVALTAMSEEARAGLCIEAVDALKRLSEAVRGGPRDDVSPQVDRLVAAIGETMGIRLDFPNPFRGEVGVRTSYGVVSYRAVQAIFQAWRLQNICKVIAGRKILEIGAGMGRTVYYARRLGLTDYTVVDLPAALVGASCFLASVLGEDSIWMLGDPAERRPDQVRLVPPTWFNAGEEKFDIALNVDSLTEMRREDAERYFFDLQRRAKILVSINHEGNWFSVKDMPRTLRIEAQTDRRPYAMRAGYFEETFVFNNESPVLRADPRLLLRWMALRPLSVAREMKWRITLARRGPLLR